MVDPASHRVPRVPWYSRTLRPSHATSPLPGSHRLRPGVPALFVSSHGCSLGPGTDLPGSRAVQPPPGIGNQTTKPDRFGLLPVRSPLLGECSLFLTLLRCFSSGGAPRHPMHSDDAAIPYRMAGCPIRISSDQCVCGRSPRLLAALHVLHRHRTPRHPPHALSFLLLSSPVSANTPLRQRCACLPEQSLIILPRHSAVPPDNSALSLSPTGRITRATPLG